MRALLLLIVLAGCGAEPQRASQPTLQPTSSAKSQARASARAERWTQVEALADSLPSCPPEMAHIGRYCVDRYEAHLRVLASDGTVVRHPHNWRPPTNAFWFAASAPDVPPQAYISRQEAATACQATGKRLCSPHEWRRACTGSLGKLYPYGHRARRQACNGGKKHLLHLKFGRGPWEYEEHFNDPALNLEPGFLATSAAYQSCVSDDGVYDMVGNVHEWVSGSVSETFVAAMDREPVERIEQRWTAGNGIFMGGFYSTANQHGAGCYYTTIAHEPSYHDYSTGFRCCMDAS